LRQSRFSPCTCSWSREQPVSEPSAIWPDASYALAGDTNPYAAEPEVFGDIYVDGVRTEDPDYFIELEPDQATRARNLGTGYYYAANPDQNSYVLRLHQFADHVSESREVEVAMEFMRPDEAPGDTLGVVRRAVQVNVPMPPAVTISGPTYIPKPANYTWTANVSGGLPPYTYQWWYRLLGGAWQQFSGETNSTYTRYVGYSQWAFRLRADVTDSLGLVGSGHIVVDVPWGARIVTDPAQQ
jgi:hypothetical protein